MRHTSALAGSLSATVARIYLQRVGICAKGPLYDTFEFGIDGKPGNRLAIHSRMPALDTARICAYRGLKGFLELWRPGAKAPCMIVAVEAAAKLTVIDSAEQGPRFTTWKPFDAECTGIVIADHPAELGAASA
jgi:hypothetical protein